MKRLSLQRPLQSLAYLGDAPVPVSRTKEEHLYEERLYPIMKLVSQASSKLGAFVLKRSP